MKNLTIKFLLLAGVSSLIVGCGQPKALTPEQKALHERMEKLRSLPEVVVKERPIEYHDSNTVKGNTEIRVPEINVINKVEIGENLYTKYFVYLDDKKIVKINNKEIFTEDGDEGYLNRQLREGKFKIFLYKYNGKNSLCNIRYGDTFQCLVDTDDNFTFDQIFKAHDGMTHYPKGSTMNDLSYKLEDYKIAHNSSINYNVLFQGKINNKIKISFREFKEDIARPAFTQDIEYELEKDKPTIIGFKGLRIEVLEATNLDIKYKVIKDYN